jgi:Flp pilus assembly protein TadG
MVTRPHRMQSGAALVEAAITLPIVFTFIAAIVQFGYAYSVLITLQNASVVAARTATLSTGRTTTEVCAAARAAVATMLEPTQVACVTTPSALPATPDTLVTVGLSYSIPVLMGSELLSWGQTWTLRAQAAMQ